MNDCFAENYEMCATGVRLRSPVLFVTARHLKTLAAQSCRQWHTENSFAALPERATTTSLKQMS
jgi:hypothetical protein